LDERIISLNKLLNGQFCPSGSVNYEVVGSVNYEVVITEGSVGQTGQIK